MQTLSGPKCTPVEQLNNNQTDITVDSPFLLQLWMLYNTVEATKKIEQFLSLLHESL